MYLPTSQDLKNTYIKYQCSSVHPHYYCWSSSDNHTCVAWNVVLTAKKKLLVFLTQMCVSFSSLSRVFVRPVTVPDVLCGLWQTPGSDNAMFTWAQWGAQCWFRWADASSGLQPQVLGNLQPAEAHAYPAKSPFQPLDAAHLVTQPVVQGRGRGEYPPAWTALHLIEHLCFITKMLLHSSDILLLLILIKYLTALKWERWRKTCNAFSDCLLSLTCN